MKIAITARGATHCRLNRKPRYTEGQVLDLPESEAKIFVKHHLAKPVAGDETPEHKPEETATDPNAEERETRGQADEGDEDSDETPEPTAKEIRAWANENGMDVPARGAIPEKVRSAYAAAH